MESNTFVTSDLHFDHRSIIQHHRHDLFSTVAEMEEALLKQINALPPRAVLYLVGDTFVRDKKENVRRVLNQVRRDISLIFLLGNHDERLVGVYREFGEVYHIFRIKHKNRKVVMCHYPMYSWDGGHHGSVLFHGHEHGSFTAKGKAIDVGWDAHRKILSVEEAFAIADKNPIHQFGHHDMNNGVIDVTELLGGSTRD